jgi:hypothetical protein
MKRGKGNAMRAHMDEKCRDEKMMLACLRVREMCGMRIGETRDTITRSSDEERARERAIYD